MQGHFGGGRGKQEYGRELCADFLWFFSRAQFSLAVLPFEVFLFLSNFKDDYRVVADVWKKDVWDF